MSEALSSEYFESDDYLAIEPAMITGLQNLGRKHVDSNERLSFLDIDPLNVDPEDYPGIRGYEVSGRPLGYTHLVHVAQAVEPAFPELMDRILDDEASCGYLQAAYELIKSGKSVVVMTNHGNLQDIAIAQAAVIGGMESVKNNTDESKDKLDIQRAIMITKMISVVGYALDPNKPDNLVPGVKALQLLCDKIFLTFPATPTFVQKGKLIDRKYAKAHNSAVKKSVTEILEEGGWLPAVAPSGSLDIDDGKGNVKLQRASKGTAELLDHPNVYLLPIAAWLRDRKRPIMELCHEPVQAAEISIHGLMNVIGERLNSRVVGKQFRYGSFR